MCQVRERAISRGLDPPDGFNLAVDPLPKLIAHSLLGPISHLLAHALFTFEDVRGFLAQVCG